LFGKKKRKSLMKKVKTEIEAQIDSLPVIGKRRYLVKSEIPHDYFQKVVDFIRTSQTNHDEIPLTYLADHLHIAYNTAKRMVLNTQNNPYYDPSIELNNRSMSDRLEDTLMQVIENEYLSKNYFFHNQILKRLALHAWDLANAEDKLKSHFTASDGWCKEFRLRHRYVWRKAHLKRRPNHDQKYADLVTQFIAKIKKLQEVHEKAGTSFLLANMDETSWKLAYPGMMTWAKKGSEEIKINLNYNSKESITAIATITHDPKYSKLPLALIAKGKTQRGEQKFGSHTDHEYWILRSETGWSNTSVM
jgi:hypothetical protein